MKYGEWLNFWLENHVKLSCKARTYERYESVIRLHILPTLADIEIEEMSAMLLQKFITSKQNNGYNLSANSVNIIITVLKSSLKCAYNFGIASKLCGDKIARPKKAEKQVECFSLIEQKKLENEIINNKKIRMYGVILCLYSGLRIGELLALKVEDIDFKTGILSVNKSCHDGKGGLVVEPPKTISSVRAIPLPRQILPLLRELKQKSKSGFLISHGEKSISVRAYQRSFDLLQARLLLPHRGFHSLRHTFATRALECGMDVKTLSEILGHKNPSITLMRYTHSLLEHKKSLMNKLGKIF